MSEVKLIQGDCLEKMKDLDDNSIDLTVTSPPYDNLRTYNNNIDKTWCEYMWKPIIKELYRITKDGGVVVWVVGDATINGSETCTSFKQALYFKEIGFNLHDTMIYSKGGQGGAKGSKYCYTQSFEYMFVFSKCKIKTSNLIIDRINKYPNPKKSTCRKTNGSLLEFNSKGSCKSKRTNVWDIRGGYMVSTLDLESFKHPAIFPEKLANDHIISWSNEGDVVLDPFMGSGTTGKMAILNNRNFIGIELDETYFNIAKKRIDNAVKEAQERLF